MSLPSVEMSFVCLISRTSAPTSRSVSSTASMDATSFASVPSVPPFCSSLWPSSGACLAYAAILVVLTGTLFLQARVAFDHPAVPPLGRASVTYLSCSSRPPSIADAHWKGPRWGSRPSEFVLLTALASSPSAAAALLLKAAAGRTPHRV
jgi:hypothetical protein